MYIQITTKCNMSCEHCCFGCEQGKPGDFMTESTFEQAAKYCTEYGEAVEIGGGEPTIHPRFTQFLLTAIAEGDPGYPPWLATNGSVKKTALLLAKLAKAGVIGCDLSQDEWHESIDQEVVEAFGVGARYQGREDSDARGVRSIPGDNLINAGAAKVNGIGMRDACACEVTFIKPDGSVYACGCEDSYYIGSLDELSNYDRVSRICEKRDEHGCGARFSEDEIHYIETGEEPSHQGACQEPAQAVA